MIDRTLTSKGQRTAERVLAAATTVLARDGLSGASLRAIAEESGDDKRTILYYFGSREALLVRVVKAFGEQIAAGLDEHLEAATEPPDPADMIEALWAGITSEPELARAYFALVADSAAAPDVYAALADIKAAYTDLIDRHIIGPTGAAPEWVTVTLATLRGLLLEWTEAGDTPELRAALQLTGAMVSQRVSAA